MGPVGRIEEWKRVQPSSSPISSLNPEAEATHPQCPNTLAGPSLLVSESYTASSLVIFVLRAS
ncbi:hypothetical protein E2C01_099174 [Portunus trituberculatus]|uniref:Uncharacterized protein n=1 Tax=Portunus trituberculatus TaxID=210409 RepID=A0A5B7K4S8_PORTR|nr:hypothetical protein [Portunus trituberculatus]